MPPSPTRAAVSPPQASIVIPTYNEKDNIVELVAQLLAAMSGVDTEVIVVDDDSPDGTAESVRQAFAGNSCVRLVERKADRGLAKSIRAGIETSRGSAIVVMDSDFNHSPQDVPILFNFTRFVDIAIGSRFIFGGGMANRWRYRLSYLYNVMLRLIIGTRIDDNLGGFFAIRRGPLFELDFDKIFWGYGDYFFRLLLLSQRAGYRHVQLPVYFGERRAGDAKTRIVRVFLEYTAAVIQLVYLRVRGKW